MCVPGTQNWPPTIIVSAHTPMAPCVKNWAAKHAVRNAFLISKERPPSRSSASSPTARRMQSVTSTGSAQSATRPCSDSNCVMTADMPSVTFCLICLASHALASTP